MTRGSLSSAQQWGITLLRVTVGVVFIVHGSQKWFVYGLHGVANSFAKMGIPAPYASAVAASTAELLCGILLVLGLFTRWAAIPIICVMLVAIIHVHASNGFFVQNMGFEYPLTLLVAALALVLTGPGEAALDNVLWSSRRP